MTERLGAGRRPRRGVPRTRTSATSQAREAIGHVPEIAGISAGGMPDRVKCLHVLAGAVAGPGAAGSTRSATRCWTELGDFWAAGPVRRPGRRRGVSVRRVAAVDCGTNTVKLLVADLDPGDRRGAASWSARAGWCGSARASTDRPAGRRGAGAGVRRRRRVRRGRRRARRRDASGSAPPRPRATPPTPTSSRRRPRRGSGWSRRWSPAPRRRSSPTTAPPAACPTSSRRCWSSTSAAARPSWCSATRTARCGPGTPSTSARCG